MNKNITFFLVLSFFSVTFSVENNTKTCSFEYTVSPKNSNDLSDFNHVTQKLLSLFESVHRNPENNTTFYDKLLTFIKELQEAVIAGVNLLSSSSSSTNEVIATINQVAQTAEDIVQTVEAVQTVQTNIAEEAPTKTIETVETTEVKQANVSEENQTKAVEIHNIKIITTISCDNPEKDALFEELKNKMDVLAQAVNTQTCTPKEFVEMLHTIIQESKELDLMGNISINVQG